MSLLRELLSRAHDPSLPFLVDGNRTVSLRDVAVAQTACGDIAPGEVVALIGDTDAHSIALLLDLVDRGAVIMPLTDASTAQHRYFFEAGGVNVVFRRGRATRLHAGAPTHPLVRRLQERGHAGLILFSSGSTGKPKAILHDFSRFLVRYATPRPAWRALNFLLFDHIGGLNTLFHTLFTGGVIVRPSARTPEAVVADIQTHNVDLLPTTPTFLRLWALTGLPAQQELPSLRLITYGTERMDGHTLSLIADALPEVDFRQTYGMSELGILRVRTRSRNELWIQVGGEGVAHKIVDEELWLRSSSRMEGYLNAPTPFDDQGWFATRDLVKRDGDWLRIIGRRDAVINVGGLKVLPAEVEHAALQFPGIRFARARGALNPVTGMHVELLCELCEGVDVDREVLSRYFRSALAPHAIPRRINFGKVSIGHRYKQL